MDPTRFLAQDVTVLDADPADLSSIAEHRIDLEPGSEEWKAYRREKFNGSEAGAMMGASAAETRGALLRRMATGHDNEVSDFTRDRIFRRGHVIEDQERTAVEFETGLSLEPCIVEAGILSSSLDGFDADNGGVLWECKQWNQEKAEAVEAGQVPDCDVAQVQQGMMLTGAKRGIYSLSDGDERRLSIEVEPNPAFQRALLSAWSQFLDDIQDLDLSDLSDAPEPAKAETRESLPALVVEASGAIQSSNLPEFRERALAVFEAISTELETDEDFVQAKTDVKFCEKVEDQVGNAVEKILEQTGTVREAIDALEAVKETARQKRLELDRTVKSREKAIKAEIIDEARSRIENYRDECAAGLDGLGTFPFDMPNLEAAIKGKRKMETIRDALDQVVADSKLAIAEAARRIRANLDAIEARDDANLVRSLFPDLHQVVDQDPETFRLVLEDRVRKHAENVERARVEKEKAEARRKQRVEAEVGERESASKRQEKAKPAREDVSRPETANPATSERLRLVYALEFDSREVAERFHREISAREGVRVIGSPKKEEVPA